METPCRCTNAGSFSYLPSFRRRAALGASALPPEAERRWRRRACGGTQRRGTAHQPDHVPHEPDQQHQRRSPRPADLPAGRRPARAGTRLPGTPPRAASPSAAMRSLAGARPAPRRAPARSRTPAACSVERFHTLNRNAPASSSGGTQRRRRCGPRRRSGSDRPGLLAGRLLPSPKRATANRFDRSSPAAARFPAPRGRAADATASRRSTVHARRRRPVSAADKPSRYTFCIAAWACASAIIPVKLGSSISRRRPGMVYRNSTSTGSSGRRLRERRVETSPSHSSGIGWPLMCSGWESNAVVRVGRGRQVESQCAARRCGGDRSPARSDCPPRVAITRTRARSMLVRFTSSSSYRVAVSVSDQSSSWNSNARAAAGQGASCRRGRSADRWACSSLRAPSDIDRFGLADDDLPPRPFDLRAAGGVGFRLQPRDRDLLAACPLRTRRSFCSTRTGTPPRPASPLRRELQGLVSLGHVARAAGRAG